MSIFGLLNKIESNFQHLNFDLEDIAGTYKYTDNPSTITVNFNANTVGDHYVGYSFVGDDNAIPTFNFNDPNLYEVITVSVTEVGAQEVTIPIFGSLYCANLVYFGYIIAACQPQTDTSGNGMPDLAVTWSKELPKQNDPLIRADITCVGMPIDELILTANPGPCTDGVYNLQFNEVTPGDEITPAVGTLTVSGSTYTVDMTNQGVYKVAPTITVVGNDCAVQPAFDVTLETTTSLDLSSLVDPTMQIINLLGATPVHDFEIGGFLILYVDATQIASLPAEFTYVENGTGHCESCNSVDITGVSETGQGLVTYQTAWDGRNIIDNGSMALVSQVIKGQTGGYNLNIGCVMLDTVTVSQDTLTDEPSITQNSCGGFPQ